MFLSGPTGLSLWLSASSPDSSCLRCSRRLRPLLKVNEKKTEIFSDSRLFGIRSRNRHISDGSGALPFAAGSMPGARIHRAPAGSVEAYPQEGLHLLYPGFLSCSVC